MVRGAISNHVAVEMHSPKGTQSLHSVFLTGYIGQNTNKNDIIVIISRIFMDL